MIVYVLPHLLCCSYITNCNLFNINTFFATDYTDFHRLTTYGSLIRVIFFKSMQICGIFGFLVICFEVGVSPTPDHYVVILFE